MSTDDTNVFSSIDYFTNDKILYIMKGYNNVLHDLLKKGKYVMIVEHDLSDPRKFTIVKDNYYQNNKLEGARLAFENQEEFNKYFPEFSAPPPVHIPTNMEQDPVTGDLRPAHQDPYYIQNAERQNGKVLLHLGRDVEIGAVWIRFATNDNRVSIAVSSEEQFNNGKKFAYIPHLINIEHIHEASYNLTKKEDELIKARYIAIITNDRIDNVNVTKAKIIEE